MTDAFREMNDLDIYTSSPSPGTQSDQAYVERLRRVAEWSDRAGCRGMLIYTDNRAVDPWVLAQDVIVHTRTLAPLIAVQPAYMHPYAASQKVAALARVYGRSVDLNFVAGGFQLDLVALGDRLEHEARYERLAEYGSVITRLLTSDRVTFQGRHYSVFGLKLEGRPSPELLPRLTVSGSSPDGRQCAGALGAVAVMYPEPLAPDRPFGIPVFPDEQTATLRVGIRIAILARATADEALAEAERRFPDDARGQRARDAAVQVSDSSWLHQLSTLAADHSVLGQDVYWLGPFRNGKSFCPYLVGSYDDVAAYVSAYLRGGVRLIILDCPREEQDLAHAHTALRLAMSALTVSAT
jgi:alkanesulfonate monooxygenase